MSESKYDLTVIIPTYNERDNIVDLIRAINNQFEYHNVNGEILVIDDNSPDGTANMVNVLAETRPNVRCIVRKTDKGLSQSVVDGFKNAQSDIFVVIDADFSHPVACTIALYKNIKKGADIAIGSRYMKGGDIQKWGATRHAISSGATHIARILFPDVTDPVSGLFAVRKSVVENANLRPSGYKILTEILGKGTYQTVIEVPYKFVNRKRGASKLGFRQIYEYAVQILEIVVHALIAQNNQVWHEIIRITRFMVVGLSGIFVNLLVLYSLVEGTGMNYIIAGFFAIEASIISNFYFNDRWTFSDLRNSKLITRIYRFHAVSFVGMLINVAVLAILTYFGIWYMLSQVIGIFVAFSWNFIGNRRKTWV
jgi:dolichol-phosphate mannosyltransferase